MFLLSYGRVFLHSSFLSVESDLCATNYCQEKQQQQNKQKTMLQNK